MFRDCCGVVSLVNLFIKRYIYTTGCPTSLQVFNNHVKKISLNSYSENNISFIFKFFLLRFFDEFWVTLIPMYCENTKTRCYVTIFGSTPRKLCTVWYYIPCGNVGLILCIVNPLLRHLVGHGVSGLDHALVKPAGCHH